MSNYSYAGNKNNSLCSYEWPPHHGKSLKNGGYTAEIIRQIFEPQGYNVKKNFYPWKRAQKNAIDGKSVKSMLGIQDVPQIGTKAIESIHNFTRDDKDNYIQKSLDI